MFQDGSSDYAIQGIKVVAIDINNSTSDYLELNEWNQEIIWKKAENMKVLRMLKADNRGLTFVKNYNGLK